MGTEGNGSLQFSYPTDVAYNIKNRMVYVVDWGNCRVQVLNSDLTFSSTFGKAGSGKGQLGGGEPSSGRGQLGGPWGGPWGIACDSTGKVYVADRANHRIQVFTAKGAFLQMFGRGQLDRPSYIAISNSGSVYVTSLNLSVSVFTTHGQFLCSFGTYRDIPERVAVDDSGVVYVCYYKCIKVF